MYALRLIESVRELGPETFAQLEGVSQYPFLRYEFLDALEQTGCLGGERGWIVRHLLVERGRELLAFLPGYIKLHSFGEFVFDQPIAQFAEERLGLSYYPKWIFAVPFTPATGPRILWAPGVSEEEQLITAELLTGGVPDICEKLELSSAHFLFTGPKERSLLNELGWAERTGVQFQWRNRGWNDFEQFLGSLGSKRRSAVRRERKRLAESWPGSIRSLSGEELGSLSPRLVHELYLSTVDKYVYGQRYLTVEFFAALLQQMPDALQLCLAEDERGQPVAGAFNLLGQEALYGRYWGCFREVEFLHFELCLYRGIEECFQRGLSRFEPGAGGAHKQSRGFLPTATYSQHCFLDARLDRAVRDFYAREQDALRAQWGLEN